MNFISLFLLFMLFQSNIFAQGVVVKPKSSQTPATPNTQKPAEKTKVLQLKVSEGVEFEGHNYVDLGLPSGTLWATRNIGADQIEDIGDFFTWGATMPGFYGFGSYIWQKSTLYYYTKYCNQPKQGHFDNNTELDPEDDAATMNWGLEWCIPSREQFQELIDNRLTTCSAYRLNGVSGCLIISKNNGKSVFFPFGGCTNSAYKNDGFYWSCSLDSSEGQHSNEYAHCCFLSSLNSKGYASCIVQQRHNGLNIRPVRNRSKLKIHPSISQGNNSDGHLGVDLALPSGTIWATCNIGAKEPVNQGYLFAWGDTIGYTYSEHEFGWSTYSLCDSSSFKQKKYCSAIGWGIVDNKIILDPEDDAADKIWGNGWTMPTVSQAEELMSDKFTTRVWTTECLVYGLKITSKKNGNSIFLPATGPAGNLSRQGYYWVNSRGKMNDHAFCFFFNTETSSTTQDQRYRGHCIRPVYTK